MQSKSIFNVKTQQTMITRFAFVDIFSLLTDLNKECSNIGKTSWVSYFVFVSGRVACIIGLYHFQSPTTHPQTWEIISKKWYSVKWINFSFELLDSYKSLLNSRNISTIYSASTWTSYVLYFLYFYIHGLSSTDYNFDFAIFTDAKACRLKVDLNINYIKSSCPVWFF